MLKNTKVLTGVSKTFLRGVSRLASIGTVFSIASVGYDVSAYSRKEISIEQLIGSITITTINGSRIQNRLCMDKEEINQNK